MTRASSAAKVGRWSKGFFLACAIMVGVTGPTIVIFFPENLGGELEFGELLALIPILVAGGAGIVLGVVAWAMNPCMHDTLDLDIEMRADGRYFGRLTRFLAAILDWYVLLVSLFFVLAPNVPRWKYVLCGYVLMCLGGFVVHLATFFNARKQRATTTLMMIVGPICSAILVPVLWPALWWFNRRARYCDDFR